MELLENGAATVRYVHAVNGGRLTKWKGQLASCAPMVGLVLASLVTASPAMATNECGADAAGPDTLNCASGTYTSGIIYLWSDGLTLNLNDPGINAPVVGVVLRSGSNGTNAVVVNANSFGTIATSGYGYTAIEADNEALGDATTTMGGGAISTQGRASYGLHANVGNNNSSGASAVTMAGGTITTAGTTSHGIFNENHGQGDAVTTIENGSIATSGADAYGAWTWIYSSTSHALAHAEMNGGSISTAGDRSFGLYVQTTTQGGDAEAILNGGVISTTGKDAQGIRIWELGLSAQGNATIAINAGDITTSGQNSSAAQVLINYAAATGVATVSMDGATSHITTTGDNAHGLYAQNNGLGNAVVSLANGTVSTSGANADGILALSGGGQYQVAVTGGSITSGTGMASAIHTSAASGGTIDIGAGAIVDGSTSGAAIRDGDLNRDGIDEIGGNAVVTSAGTVTGDAILGLGNDVFNLTGGSYTGAIFGDDAGISPITTLAIHPMSAAVSSASDGNDTFNWSGGTLVGGFNGQNGSDTALITAATYDGTQILDGGDDLSAADGWVDTLTLKGVHATTAGANLKNWENIVIDGGTVAISDGMLETGSDAGTGLTLTNGGILDAGTALALMGNMTVDPNSTFKGTGAGAGVYSISGNVTNNGLITTQDGVVGDTLSIAGNYSGTNGLISIDTQLGDDSSPTDQVHISGDASGTTKLNVTNVNGLGAQTTTGIDVVQVGGTSAAGSFALANNVQAGAYQYVLAQGGTGGNPNDWYLVSHYEEPTPSPAPATGPDIYRPAVPGYVTAQQDNAELGYATLGTLHQRMGEQQTLKWDYCSACGVEATRPTHQAWARIGGARIDTFGKNRFDLSQNSYFVQIGTDLVHDYDAEDKSRRTVGIMASYAEGHSYFKDRLRPLAGLELNTGRLNSTQLSVGGYFTRYAENGSYLDLVGQLSSTRNKFNDIYGVAATQSGLGLGLSAEVGRPWQIGESQWLIEPQAQLSYQHTHYRAFTDEISNIDGFNANSSRERLGVRLAWNDHLDQNRAQRKVNEVRTGTFYVTANVLQDLMGQELVTIGTTGVSEEMNARPWAELGAGAQIPLNRSVYLYGNVNYQRSLSNENLRHGVAGNIGVRAAW